MSDSAAFERQLRIVMDRCDPEVRPQAEAVLDRVVNAGGTSLRGLIAIVRDARLEIEVRCGAIWLLGRLDSKHAVPALVKALGDAEWGVRAQAARELFFLRSTRAALPLVELLQQDEHTEVRLAAAYTLVHLRDPRTFDVLIDRLSDPKEAPSVRGIVAENLWMIGKARALGPLLGALGDPSPEVRIWASYALGALGAGEALSELRRTANTDHSSVPGMGTVSDEARHAMEAIEARLANGEGG